MTKPVYETVSYYLKNPIYSFTYLKKENSLIKMKWMSLKKIDYLQLFGPNFMKT